MVCIMRFMRRIQIHIDEALDDAAEVEAARRGLSKAALIRASLVRELASDTRPDADPWQALTGWLDDGQVEDLDAVIYDQDR
jgi:Ribbon-helix-helix protein, copG family